MNSIPNASALPTWRKSSHSENAAGGCVEVSDGHPTTVPVRDSKNPHGPAIPFRNPGWTAFVTAVKDGDLV